MGETYTGDQSVDNDPNGEPEPERSPSAIIPVDGDKRNASTFQPGYKAAFDWLDWLVKPKAKLEAFGQRIMAFRNALGQPRFAIDHMGLPAGRIVHYRLGLFHTVEEPTGSLVTDGMIQYQINGFGHMSSGNLISGVSATRSMVLFTGDDPGDFTSWGTVALTGLSDDVQVAMEFTCTFDASDTSNICAGLIRVGAPFGIAFEATPSENNIQAVVSDIGGPISFDTGVAKGGNYRRCRIEYYGANRDENVSPEKRAVFFIDGAKVAEITGFTVVNTVGVGFVATHVDGDLTSMHILEPINYAAAMLDDA